MKAEELKQKAHREFQNAHKAPWIEYHFTESELEQYAAEVSRENEEWTAIEFATTYYTLGIPRESVVESFNEWYDEWKSKQEGE